MGDSFAKALDDPRLLRAIFRGQFIVMCEKHLVLWAWVDGKESGSGWVTIHDDPACTVKGGSCSFYRIHRDPKEPERKTRDFVGDLDWTNEQLLISLQTASHDEWYAPKH